MSDILATVKRFLTSEDGPTTTEYAVMLALIVFVCIASISGIGGSVRDMFTGLDKGLPVVGS